MFSEKSSDLVNRFFKEASKYFEDVDGIISVDDCISTEVVFDYNENEMNQKEKETLYESLRKTIQKNTRRDIKKQTNGDILFRGDCLSNLHEIFEKIGKAYLASFDSEEGSHFELVYENFMQEFEILEHFDNDGSKNILMVKSYI